MKLNDLLVNAIEFTDRTVKSIKPTDWNNKTTCSPWRLYELLNHVTYEWLWVDEILKGKTIAEVGEKYKGGVLTTTKLISSYLNASNKAKQAIKIVNPNKLFT